MLDILSYQFMQNAFIAGFLASILCGMIGVMIVIRKLVFISAGISHISFGGLGTAYFLNLPLFSGAVIFAVISAMLLGRIEETRIQRQDTLIGIFWAAGMAIGIVLIKLKPGYTPDISSYLFGTILTVSNIDIYIIASLTVIVSLFFIFLYKEWLAISFDREIAYVKGLPVEKLNVIIYILIALTIVMLIKIVGIILVIALLTIPPSISLLISRSIKGIILYSIIISILLIISGLLLAYYINMPSGPAIILPGVLLLLMGHLWKFLSKKILMTKQGKENEPS